MLVYKQQACCETRIYDSTYIGSQKWLRTYKAFVRNMPQTGVLGVFFFKGPNMYVHLYKNVGDSF
jgi:hypothetical protein